MGSISQFFAFTLGQLAFRNHACAFIGVHIHRAVFKCLSKVIRDCNTKCEEMCQCFKKRGYPDSAVTTGKHGAQEIDRKTALQTSQNQETNRIPLTFTYHPQNLAVKMPFSKTSNFFAMIPKLNTYLLYHHLFHSNATKTKVTF